MRDLIAGKSMTRSARTKALEPMARFYSNENFPLLTGVKMPKLSAEKRRELQKLAARPDREIDLTDIPEIREIPSDAVIGKFYRPKKTTVIIRLDADVVAWMKASGEGYQTRINAYLRQLMQHRR
jgi:uncharacterized protein (DUF4415 family)